MGQEARQFIAERQHLVGVALGQLPADLVIKETNVLNTYSGELMPSTDISVARGHIARIGSCDDVIGPDTEVIDATGLYAVPGFIDAHYHIESSLLSPRRHAEVTLPWGLTSLFYGTYEITNVLGGEALSWIASCSDALPQRIYTVMPPQRE
jgi:adenine deaminase